MSYAELVLRQRHFQQGAAAVDRHEPRPQQRCTHPRGRSHCRSTAKTGPREAGTDLQGCNGTGSPKTTLPRKERRRGRRRRPPEQTQARFSPRETCQGEEGTSTTPPRENVASTESRRCRPGQRTSKNFVWRIPHPTVAAAPCTLYRRFRCRQLHVPRAVAATAAEVAAGHQGARPCRGSRRRATAGWRSAPA